MTEPLQTQSTLDPVDAAMAAASAQNDGTTLTPQPGSETTAEAKPDASPSEPEQRKARQYAAEADAKRRAAEAQARARAEVKAVREREAALAKEKADLEAMFTGAKGNKAQIQKIMERAGLSLEDLARTLLDLDAEPPAAVTPEQALEEARAIRKELEAKEQAAQEAQKMQHSQAQYNHYIEMIKGELAKDESEKYELIKEQGAYRDVLGRSIQFLKDEGLDKMFIPPEEEALLVHFIAEKLEAELFAKAEKEAQTFKSSKKLSKLLQGITEHKDATSSEVIRDNDIASHDSTHQQVLDSLAQDTTQAVSKSNKFITNETTISSRPIAIASRNQSEADREIDELVKAFAGKKPF